MFLGYRPGIIISGDYLFILSAKSEKSLKNLLERMVLFLEHTDESLCDICYTLQVGREHFRYRIGILSNSYGDLIQELRKYFEKPILSMPSEASFSANSSIADFQMLFDQNLDQPDF